MTHILANRVAETTATIGTGPLTLGGADDLCVPFAAALAIGDTCDYEISATGLYELGRGTLTAPDALERTEVYQSSNDDDLVDLPAGEKRVWLTVLAPGTNALTAAAWRSAIGIPTPTLAPLQVDVTGFADADVDALLATVSNGVPYGVTGDAPPGTGYVIVGQQLRLKGTYSTAGTTTAMVGVDTTGGPLSFEISAEIAVAIEPEAQALYDAVVADGGVMTTPELVAHSQYVTAGKTAGWWAKVTGVGTLMGGKRISARHNLKGNLPLVFSGNSVDADLGPAGFTNSGTKWINTQVTVSQMTANGNHGMYIFPTREVSQAGYGQFMGTNPGGNPQEGIRWLGPDQSPAIDGLANGSGAPNGELRKPMGRLAAGVGLHLVRNSNTVKYYQNGVLNGSRVSNFAYAGSNEQIALLADNNGGSNLRTSIGMWAIDNGTMTDAEAESFGHEGAMLQARLGRTPFAEGRLPMNLHQGQSNTVGAGGEPALTLIQPYGNLIVDSLLNGNLFDAAPGYWQGATGAGAHPSAFGSLFERGIETPMSGAANTLSALARAHGRGDADDAVLANFGIGATSYTQRMKGTVPYANMLAAVAMMHRAALARRRDGLRIAYLFDIGGESDLTNVALAVLLAQIQAETEADLKAITGQEGIIPMLMLQVSQWTSTGNINSATAPGATQQLIAHENNAGRLVLCGPTYQFPYADDGVHRINVGHRASGGLMGKVADVLAQGLPWSPLRPTSIVRTGVNVDVEFFVPVGDMVLDTSVVSDPSPNGTGGFEYQNANIGAANRYASILDVDQLESNRWRITLAENPGAVGAEFLACAHTGIAGSSAGPTTGPRACFRDSDTTQDASGVVSRNYVVSFRKPVTVA